MNTALANNQDQLVMPIIVTGTFQHPQVAPDMHGNAALAIWAGLGYAVIDRQSGKKRDRNQDKCRVDSLESKSSPPQSST
jgi:hypothetical protein